MVEKLDAQLGSPWKPREILQIFGEVLPASRAQKIVYLAQESIEILRFLHIPTAILNSSARLILTLNESGKIVSARRMTIFQSPKVLSVTA